MINERISIQKDKESDLSSTVNSRLTLDDGLTKFPLTMKASNQSSSNDVILLAILDGGASSDSYSGLQYFNQDEVPGDFIDNDNNGYIDDYSGVDLQMNGIDGTHSGPESNNWSPSAQLHGNEMTKGAAEVINNAFTKIEVEHADAKIMHVDISENNTAGYPVMIEGIHAAITSGANVINLSFGVGQGGVRTSLEPELEGTDTILVVPKTAGSNDGFGDNIVVSNGMSFQTAQLAGQIAVILSAYPKMTPSELHIFLTEHTYDLDNYQLDMKEVYATIQSELGDNSSLPSEPVQGKSFSDSGDDDNWLGGLGNDTFFGGLGEDKIDGLDGVDTAIYTLDKSQYSITKNNENTEISSKSGNESIDVLTNVERLRFSDISIAFDVDGNAGKVFRLYEAVFNREPDSIGLGFWINTLDKDALLLDVAQGFTNSDEFISIYSDANDTDFINQLYTNILDRDSDRSGHDYWLTLLETNEASIEEVLIGFSESDENQSNTLSIIGESGIEYTPFIA